MKILAAVDLSKVSERVVEVAVDLARQQGAELTVLTVVEQFCDTLWGVPIETCAAEDQFRSQAQAFVEKSRRLAEELGIRATGMVEEWFSAADAILHHARGDDVDLIILGRMGRTGLQRFLIGSVAARVVAHAPCSVLVVR